MGETVSTREQGRRHPPMASHRLFPWACGLWFATLFMACALVVPVTVLERGAALLGLDRVLPAAAPPLGETSRLLIAVGLSSVGEILGLILGRMLAARSRPVRAGQDSTTFTARPLSVERDLPAVTDSPAMESTIAIDECETPGEDPPVVAIAPLDALGIVQLSERLAMAMRARRERGDRAEVENGDAPIVLRPRSPSPDPRSPEGARLRPEALTTLRQLSGAR